MYNHQLDTFIKVADAGSFNKASEELYVSPNAVMKQINLLENSLGFDLFVRTHRGVQLTASGRILVPGCEVSHPICQRFRRESRKDGGRAQARTKDRDLIDDAGPVFGQSVAPDPPT